MPEAAGIQRDDKNEGGRGQVQGRGSNLIDNNYEDLVAKNYI